MSDAYENINLRLSWGGCSLLLFGLMVAMAVSLPYLIPRVRMDWLRWMFVLLPLSSLLGTLAGAVGLRQGRSSAAVIGLLLNGTVLASVLSAALISILRH